MPSPVKATTDLIDPSNQAKTDFIFIETEVGLTFAGIARDTSDIDKRKRVTHYARKAYDTAKRLRNAVQLSALQDAKLTRRLMRLRQQLQHLGETF